MINPALTAAFEVKAQVDPSIIRFSDEEWEAFAIGDLRWDNWIKSGGSWFSPGLEEWDSWIKSGGLRDQVELISPQLSEALKVKTKFSAEEWEDFGISGLHLGHVVVSRGSYYLPFSVPEAFLPKARAPCGRERAGRDVRELERRLLSE